MIEFEKPYWIIREDMAGIDFNRSIVEPGEKEGFPDGAVGIYVDDDFWCVAALPLDRYRDVPIERIVEELWPTYSAEATYAPDHGTIEQTLHYARKEIESLTERATSAEDRVRELREERDRMKAGRTDVSLRSRTRLEASNGYFIQQYEHLLVAMAHEAVPRTDALGICSSCGLYVSDRVHEEQWIGKKADGHEPAAVWSGTLGDDRSVD